MPRFRIVLALGVLCLMVASICLLHDSDPCARMKHLSRNAGRLGLRYPRPYRIRDYIFRIVHHREPFDYYCTELGKEEQRLLASGYLVKTPVRIGGGRSDRDVHIALHSVCERTGAYCSASRDGTNDCVLLISKPQDVATFSAALK